MQEEYLPYNQKMTVFPDGKIEIIKYSQPKIRVLNKKQSDNMRRELTAEEKERQKVQQAFRIKRKIKHYCLSNKFDLFWTLTFNDEEVNALDYVEARKVLQAWLKYQREKYGKFDYIFVPELHKSGRIHFHGLTKNLTPPLFEAINPKTKRKIRKNGKQIYNAENWKKGFSTVSKIHDNAKTSSYITKYITKELLEVPTGYHQPHYFVSRGLQLPDITYKNAGKDNLEEFTPSFIAMNVNLATQESEKIVSIYNLTLDEDGSLRQTGTVETTVKSRLINNTEDNRDEHYE
ncbi:hypothetical protein J2T50_002137 [Streptococcus gallinaceus]|uniref:rolling circle replication-associated protein n=1 Tax=Streptococcus gallinaceus TaxID=165758 RepID=UPI00209CB2E3|nr:hypothetical protein [Streptococcus gallinaceus]MCP1640398.1 hypothetical protein [Streptococcus gallinaceus]MCP1771181.1 hypothetical protein [Streptococcus gallinaceus]